MAERSRAVEITRVSPADVDEALPLLQAYCSFYEVDPGEDALRATLGILASEPATGLALLARRDGAAVGLATLCWSLSSLRGARVGIMNDLYVVPSARGSGVGEALIEACVQECTRRDARQLSWQTAEDNLAARRLYDRIGARASRWMEYDLPVGDPPAREPLA